MSKIPGLLRSFRERTTGGTKPLIGSDWKKKEAVVVDWLHGEETGWKTLEESGEE